MNTKSASRHPGKVAIVGIGCRFPGAPDLCAYWENLVAGKEIAAAAAEGALSPPLAGSDAEERLLFDVTQAALLDAGLDRGREASLRVETVIGRRHGRCAIGRPVIEQTLGILRTLHPEWTDADRRAIRTELEACLPLDDRGRANRIALGGTEIAVKADGASSILALDIGSRALLSRRADLVLAGAVHLHEGADPDGLIPGEGAGVVVLKRLTDAERDGDHIYAVLRGIGSAPGSLSRAAGLARAHARAMRRAYRTSGMEPDSIGLVELAGRQELRALRAVFPPSQRRVLHSAGSTVSRATPISGMAGLIASALALHHRTLPPTRDADRPNPRLAHADRPAGSIGRVRPWIQGASETPRRAAVSVSGSSGLGAHAVLEEHSKSADGVTPGAVLRWDSEAILLGVPDCGAWHELARALIGWIDRNPGACLKDVAYTLNVRQPQFPFRVGLVATSLADLRARLVQVGERLADPSCTAIRDARGAYWWDRPARLGGKIAFLYPGEGSQYPGMLADLCIQFPEVRTLFDTSDRVAREQGRSRLPSDLLFGDHDADDARLWSMGWAINLVLTSQWALHGLLTALGLEPEGVAGHSSGEFLALGASGAIAIDRNFEDGLTKLGDLFEDFERTGRIPPAALLAVAADSARAERVLAGRLGRWVVAMDNCPHQVVLAGPIDEADAVAVDLRGEGILCDRLPFERAYHTESFAGALGPVRDFFRSLPVRTPEIPLYSCAAASRIPDDIEVIRRLATEQWARRVDFRRTIETMYEDGFRLFVEVGTRGNLTGFVEDTLRGRDSFAIAANLPRRSGLLQLNHLVASLFAQGIPIRPEILYARRRPERVDFAAERNETQRGRRLRVDVPELKLSAALAERLRGRSAGGAGSIAVDGIPESHAFDLAAVDDRVVAAYRRTMSEFLDTQREVMHAFLHGTVSTGEDPETQGSGRDAEPVEAGPWVGEIVRLLPGRELVSRRILDRRDDPVAANHTLGSRRVSALDPERKGLPVVPFTVMAEMLAQAAAVLAPGLVVVGMRDVHAHRWIRYEEGPSQLELRAERKPGEDEVRVEIYNLAVDRSHPLGVDQPVVEGCVLFSTEREPSPPATSFQLPDQAPCRFTADELYRDQWLFHGPPLQSLVHVGLSSPRGIEGALRVLDRRGLLKDDEPGSLLTDAIVLDNFTHLLGAWGLDRLTEGDVVFPLRLRSLKIFGADPAEGVEVACRIDVCDVEQRRLRANADLVRPDGRLWMRLDGWEDWRFYWPSRFRDGFRQPDRFLLAEPLDLEGAPAGLAAVWLEPPADMGRPVWRDVLEWNQLHPEERAALLSRKGTEASRTLRLWGRIAAKDAVRRLLLAQGGSPVYPGDIEIANDAQGRPFIRPTGLPETEHPPALSIAHTQGVAVAIASLDPGARVGIDVEPIVTREEGFEAAAFSPAERMLLDRFSAHRRPEWVARLWCAKEAAAKASGHGMAEGPGSVEVVSADVDGACMTVAMRPDVAERSGMRNPIRVRTARRADYAWAWTIGEETER